MWAVGGAGDKQYMSQTTSQQPRHRTEPEPTTDDTERPCPECNGRTREDPKRGEIVCEDCSLVVSETVLDRGPERHDRDDDSDRRRVGAPTTKRFHDEGLSTVIGGGDCDANGNRMSARKQRRMRRLRTWNTRYVTQNARERALQFGLSELDRMASALELSETIRETASVVFRRAHSAGVQRGRSLEATATAALFATVRRDGIPLTIEDVAATSRIDRESFERAYRDVVRELGLEISPPDPADHVPGLVSALDGSDALCQRALSLVDRVKATDYHVGKHPNGLAAAAVYAATLIEDEGLTQAEIGDEADISVVTIRTHYTAMLEAWREDR